jgi:ribose 5-phosphate isomerase A
VSADDQKRIAGAAAAERVNDGMTVGLGTGSTAAWFVRALGARVAQGLKITGVPTSEATAQLARDLGIPLKDLADVRRIDLTVDGADEIGPGLSLIKGGGAALLREKLVWEASNHCLVIADAAKRVPVLGRFPLPIEVVAFGCKQTADRIADVLAEHDIGTVPKLRLKDGAPVKTDGGNLIYDAACGAIENPSSLAEGLKSVTGVVDHGLFLDLADEGLVGTDAGVEAIAP